MTGLQNERDTEAKALKRVKAELEAERVKVYGGACLNMDRYRLARLQRKFFLVEFSKILLDCAG